MAVEFEEGVEIMVMLRYENLYGFCKECFRLTHDSSRCPTLVNEVKEEKVIGGGKGPSDGGLKSTSFKATVESEGYFNGGRREGVESGHQGNKRSYKEKGKGFASGHRGGTRQEGNYHPYKEKVFRNAGEDPYLKSRNGNHGERFFSSQSRGKHHQDMSNDSIPSNNHGKLMGDAFKSIRGSSSEALGQHVIGNETGSNSKARKALRFEDDSNGQEGDNRGKEECFPQESLLSGGSMSEVLQAGEGTDEKVVEEQGTNQMAQEEKEHAMDGALLSDSELMLEDGEDMEDWEEGEVPDFLEAMEEEGLGDEEKKEDKVVDVVIPQEEKDGEEAPKKREPGHGENIKKKGV